MTPVTSSNIKAVGYDAANKRLTVQFNSGAIHAYEGVPPETHTAMMKTDGKGIGSFFHKHIRSAGFKSAPVPAKQGAAS